MITARYVLAALLGSIPIDLSAVPTLNQSDLARHFAAALEDKTLQAVSAAVIQGDHSTTVHLGTLQRGESRPPDDHTLYEIGSVSKIFTSLLLAEAVVRGEVTLDMPIADLLPGEVALPDGAGARITLRMLATHTSGLPRIPADLAAAGSNPYAGYGERELWASLRAVKLDFEPGTKASYSNFAVGLLGTLLARKAGLSYEQLLTRRITQPLGMTETVVSVTAMGKSHFAPPFTADGKPSSHWDFDALAGAGGIRSTLADMKRFAIAALQPAGTRIAKAMEMTWAAQDLATTASPGGQGLGWMIARDRTTRWHNGMTGGFHAAIFVNRKIAAATIVLMNRSSPIGTELAESLVRRAAGVLEPNRGRAEVALTPEQIDRCIGTFRINAQFALHFERRNDVLFLTPTGQSTDRLYAASAETFFSRRVAADIVFEFPPDGGPAGSLVLKQSGREMRAKRQ
jgi:CubicO group peptidase (beta-lactamase class C family)